MFALANSWHTFRDEGDTMSSAPDVLRDIEYRDGLIGAKLTCNELHCKWTEYGHKVSEIEHLISTHQEWHSEGCPE